MDIQGIDIKWLGHDGFRLEKGLVVYVDPFKLKEARNDADVLLITHEHFDHCNPEDIPKVIKPETIIIATPDCQSKLTQFTFKELKVMEPGQLLRIGDLAIEAVPSYNVNKFREPGVPFHSKEDQKIGYVITLAGKRIYHAGDTDHIPEMDSLKDIDIAFLPVSGTYVMTAEEAITAVKSFKPKLAIPMHYGEIVGSIADAEKFKAGSSVPVQILEKE